MNVSEEIAKVGEGLRQQRDELVVQLNLAKLEVKQEWDKVEHQLEQWQVKADAALIEAKTASDDIVAGLGLLADEIKAAYERIRDRL
ncbi:MAG: hypothetical protein U1E83_11685 [Methylotetracoccus sp.]